MSKSIRAMFWYANIGLPSAFLFIWFSETWVNWWLHGTSLRNPFYSFLAAVVFCGWTLTCVVGFVDHWKQWRKGAKL